MNTMGNACERKADVARKTVAELLVDVLAGADVEMVYVCKSG
jgi:hypothetical protein